MKKDEILIIILIVAAIVTGILAYNEQKYGAGTDGDGVSWWDRFTESIRRKAYSHNDSLQAIKEYYDSQVINVDALLSEIDTTATEHLADNLDRESRNEPHMEINTGKLEWVMRTIGCGNSKALTSLMQFPIPRKYPMHDIADAKDLQERFTEIFDEKFRKKMSLVEMSAWTSHGYHGYCYGRRGDLWVTDKLYLIDYYSPKEQARYEQLVKDEMGSLHKSLRGKGWRPYCCFKTDKGDVIRVDYAQRKNLYADNIHMDEQSMSSPQPQPIKLRGDEIFRMAVFTKGSNLHEAPSEVMYGYVQITGSLSAREHQFRDSHGRLTTFGDPFYYDDDFAMFSSVIPNTHETRLSPCYWLDLIGKKQ